MLSCEVQEDADDESRVGHYKVYMHSIIFILFCNYLTLLYLDSHLGDFCPFTRCLHVDRSIKTISLVLWFYSCII